MDVRPRTSGQTRSETRSQRMCSSALRHQSSEKLLTLISREHRINVSEKVGEEKKIILNLTYVGETLQGQDTSDRNGRDLCRYGNVPSSTQLPSLSCKRSSEKKINAFSDDQFPVVVPKSGIQKYWFNNCYQRRAREGFRYWLISRPLPTSYGKYGFGSYKMVLGLGAAPRT